MRSVAEMTTHPPAVGVEFYADREMWLAGRNHPEAYLFSLGASDVASNLVTNNPSRFRNSDGSWWLWVQKNPAAREKHTDGLAEYESWKAERRSINFEARKRLEPDIQAMIEEREELAIFDPGDFCILRSVERPWTHVSPDGLIVNGTGSANLESAIAEGTVGPATEYKTIHPFARHGWDEHEPNLDTLVQVHHGMWVTGWEHAIVGAFIGYGDSDQERLVYRVERNEDLIEVIEDAVDRFRECVIKDMPPPPDGFSATSRAIRMIYAAKPKSKGATITLGSQFVASHIEYLSNKRNMDRLERRQKQLQQEIEAEMGTHDAGVAFVPASQELPNGAKWIRFSTQVKPSTCKECGVVTRKGYEGTRCQAVKE